MDDGVDEASVEEYSRVRGPQWASQQAVQVNSIQEAGLELSRPVERFVLW